ncbi:hypothetical protein FHS18_001264 [Paenibacillus phyllosphaerae]|uniref:Uncharacterized protein n=1 Tax=Paenibacillus phyllosphaerae TaxID=274593 RepID=A0A7W5FLN9_9BACL|nr:hypothetical protein [Paenibacillus phyllosphaerae]
MILVLCTTIMYNGCRILGDWITPENPYRVPQGAALKVFGNEQAIEANSTFSERLRLFYWYGE